MKMCIRDRFTFESPNRQKIRRYKTVLVRYLVPVSYTHLENTALPFRDVPDVNVGKMGLGCFVRFSPAKISGFVLSVQL